MRLPTRPLGSTESVATAELEGPHRVSSVVLEEQPCGPRDLLPGLEGGASLLAPSRVSSVSGIKCPFEWSCVGNILLLPALLTGP